ncbi:hypothetical protein BDQ17DRAFT_966596 [Cyathus striatus]|nr:hypothetical protein BDQ17DRAFT_966596 [Cyathus striatus]
MRNVTYLHAASLVILAFETFLTLDIEVEFIWSAPWNVVKVLYLVTRYLAFIDSSLNVLIQLMPDASEPTCKILYQVGTWIIMTGMCLAELILTIRTWAVLGKKRWQAVFFFLLFVGIWGSAYTIVALFSGPYAFTLQDALQPFLKGCFATVGSVHYLQITWALLLVYDGVLMLLMLVPAYETRGQSKLVRAVFRDGIIYYIYLFTMTLGNLIVTRKLSNDYFTIIMILERVIHAVLACRVILHMREQAWKGDHVHISTISGI